MAAKLLLIEDGSLKSIPKRIHVSGPGQTSGAATAVLASLPLVDGKSYAIRVWTVGREANGDTVAGQKLAAAKRVSGTSSVVGVDTINLLVTDAALAASAVTVVLGTNTADLQVTGVLATTIDWWGDIEALEFEP